MTSLRLLCRGEIVAEAKKKSKAPRPPTIKERLNAIGIEAICSRVESGESFREIAANLEISVSNLSEWMNSDVNAERSARAKELSAESWLDRGLDAIKSSMSKSGDVDATAARAYAQECARRAAIRNPQYRDKQTVDMTVATISPEEREARISALLSKK